MGKNKKVSDVNVNQKRKKKLSNRNDKFRRNDTTRSFFKSDR